MDNAHTDRHDHASHDLGSAATERALEIYNQMQACDATKLGRARKIIADHIDGLIGACEHDEQKLVVRALTHLKALDREHATDSAIVSV